MLQEKQKQIIFLSNCLYQLESQIELVRSKQPIELFPELGIYAMFEKRTSESIDWDHQLRHIVSRLQSYGLTNNWIDQLTNQIHEYIGDGHSVNGFRLVYMSAIDKLLDMVLEIVQISDPSIPKDEISDNVIQSIFHENYWQGSVVKDIVRVRKLNTELGFSLSFVQELYRAIINCR